MEHIFSIDRKIADTEEDDTGINQLLGEQAIELESLLQDVFHSKHIADENHHAMLEKYRETVDELTRPLTFYINTLLYLNRVGSYLKKGMGKVVSDLIDSAKN